MFKMSIPKISNEELLRRYEQVKPVINLHGNLYYLREYTLKELRAHSFYFNRLQDFIGKVGDDCLEIMEGKDFICLHNYVYSGIFNPTVGEVLSQIKQLDLSNAIAFEIIDIPELEDVPEKDSFKSIAFDNGYVVSTVRLYRQKK